MLSVHIYSHIIYSQTYIHPWSLIFLYFFFEISFQRNYLHSCTGVFTRRFVSMDASTRYGRLYTSTWPWIHRNFETPRSTIFWRARSINMTTGSQHCEPHKSYSAIEFQSIKSCKILQLPHYWLQFADSCTAPSRIPEPSPTNHGYHDSWRLPA